MIQNKTKEQILKALEDNKGILRLKSRAIRERESQREEFNTVCSF